MTTDEPREPTTLETIVREMPTETAMLVAVLGAAAQDEIIAIFKARELSMAPVVMKQSLRVRVFHFARERDALVGVATAVMAAGFVEYYRAFPAHPRGASTYWSGSADADNGIDLVVVAPDADPRDALAWRPKMRPGGVVWLIEQGVAV